MEWICPECMGTLKTDDGQTARCLTHGGQFQILFSRRANASIAPPPLPPLPGETAMCRQHPSVSAVFACKGCQAPICLTCAFAQDDGTRLCPDCMIRASQEPSWGGPASTETVPPGVCCGQHKTVPATQKCRSCAAYMCATCDFLIGGTMHFCPKCATNQDTTLSSRRKKLMVWSYVMAVVATFGLIVVMSGMLSGLGRSKGGDQAVGTLMMMFIFFPAVIGMGVGFSAIDRRFANPMPVWIATIWNAIYVIGFMLLCIIGLFSK